MLKQPEKTAKIEELLQCGGTPQKEWLIQISGDFLEVWKTQFLNQHAQLENIKVSKLLGDFCVLRSSDAISAQQLLKTIFPRWITPLHHQWPTKVTAQDFIERAAQTLFKKFCHQCDEVSVFSTTPSLKKIAAALKSRLLQIRQDAPKQKSSATVILSVIVDVSGLFAGYSPTRLQTGTALPGGLGFLVPRSSATEEINQPISRASGKLREVLGLLQEINLTTEHYRTWLELGAAPGGMTKYLLEQGAYVTAVDLADMSQCVLTSERLTYLRRHAQDIESASSYDALLSDMNGPFLNSAKIVSALGSTMRSGSLLIFTLKLSSKNEIQTALNQVTKLFSSSGIRIIQVKHLFHNRQEVTLICERC